MSIERTRKGSFQIRYTDKAGKRQTYKTVEKFQEAIINGENFRGYKLAVEIQKQMHNKIQNDNLGILDLSLSPESLAQKYVNNCRGLRMEEETLRNKSSALRKFFAENKIETLADLSHDGFIRWRDGMFTGNEVGTIRTHLSQVRAFMNWLVESKYLVVNPFGKKIMPKEEAAEPKFYTTVEWMILDKAAEKENHRFRLFCNLCHSAGLRRNESVQVRWEHMQFYPDGCADLRLPKEICKYKKGRVVPVDDALLRLLGTPPVGGGPIVGLSYGKVYSIFNRVRRVCGINPELDIHGLRHTFAKNYLLGGGNMKALKDLLGHESVVTTQIYSQFERSHLREGIDRSYQRRLLEEGKSNGTFGVV